MKAEGPDEDDDSLRALLKEWRVATPLPPRFQEQVWQRIERSEARPAAPFSLLTKWMYRIATIRPRPAWAVSYLVALLAIGATVGWAQGRQEMARVSGELSVRYVRSVDPYQPIH